MMQEKSCEKEVVSFCNAWFQERNREKTLSYLSDDVTLIDTGLNCVVKGKKEVSEYIEIDFGEIKEPFQCTMTKLYDKKLCENIRELMFSISLKNSLYQWNLKGFFITNQTEPSKCLITSMHFAEPSRTQKEGEHYPDSLVMEKIAIQRHELLSESVLGGMVGGYLEPGFPFYYINHRMLDYLGYENEEEFVKDIDGHISNCVHPEEREEVERYMFEQLQLHQEYTIEYRMKKKDGTYIWVHDLGKTMISEDGRKAVSSVCVDITELKETQRELLHIHNNIPGAVFCCRNDEIYSVENANDGLYEMLHCTREEFVAMGNQMAMIIYEDDLQMIREKIKQRVSNDFQLNEEIRLICKNTKIKWVSAKVQLFTEKNGEQYFYGVFVDITEEKILQERMKELYDKELAYFVALSTEEGSIQGRVNVTQNRLENYISTAEVSIANIGDTYDDVVYNLARVAVDDSYSAYILQELARDKVLKDYDKGKTDYQFEYLRRNNSGGMFWSNTGFRCCLQPETGEIFAFFYTKDITEVKMREELLNKLAILDYDNITEVDMHHDHHHILNFDSNIYQNIPKEGKFSESILEVANQMVEERYRSQYIEYLSYDYMKERLEKEDTYSFLIEMKHTDGSVRIKRLQAFYIDKELGRACVVRSDVTEVVHQEQKQKEDLASALMAAEQANAAKSDFLSRMSHEIRTPMNAIIGMSAIAAQSIGNEEHVAECISKIGISSRFLLSLINDILDMSRIESGKLLLKNEKIPTEEFLNGINSICYAQANTKGVDFECIVDAILDDYYIGDAMKLQQVLINILSNAIKFTDEGGKVTFSAALRKNTSKDALIRFVINDTGIGMSEDFIPHIFEPFSQEFVGTTSVYGGTGLGLAISKNIVDLMDGKITVRSIKGIGTEFTVDVKLGLVEDEKKRIHFKQHELMFSELKTLVVDDDVIVCESAVMTLKEIGVKAEWVDSGNKAIEKVKEKYNCHQYYDMILIDWKMPEMDGIETARKIRTIVGPEVTIIIMTAYDWIAIEKEAKLAGVNLLISKPMFKSSIVSAFTKVLHEKEEEQFEEKQIVMDFDFSGKRVLLAEDNAINTEVAMALLENKGFVVECAENGLRAMEMFSKSTPGYYDAILMDIRMPFMDGLTATTTIRHLSNTDAKTIPIIAMTANAFDDDIEKSKKAGMNAHLAKPIEPDRMYQTLYDLIYEQ